MQGKILLTGANGFVGTCFIKSFNSLFDIVGVYRNKGQVNTPEHVLIDCLDAKIDWSPHLADIECIVHCAARVHIMQDKSSDPLLEFRNVNTHGTLNLARQAAEAGVKRFVFLSTIKVNGEFTNSGEAFAPENSFMPTDPYGISKYEAEVGLKKIARNTDMEVVIIRPPLVYGPSVKANFRSMLKWVEKGIPMPFGAIDNKRSLVAISNLVDFIKCCISHPKAANETFLISDGEDVSTTVLLYKIAKAFNQKTRLLPIPVKLMQVGARLLGKKDLADRIFGNLQVDSSKARELLGWMPVVTINKELEKTVDAYLNEKNI